MLISNKVGINLTVNFDLTFDDATKNHTVSVKQGDTVTVTMRVSRTEPETVTFTGVITKIIATMPLENDVNPTLVIDASETYSSKVYTVQAFDIMDINTEQPIL